MSSHLSAVADIHLLLCLETKGGVSCQFIQTPNPWRFKPPGNRCLQQVHSSIWIDIFFLPLNRILTLNTLHTISDISHSMQYTMEVTTGAWPLYFPMEKQINTNVVSRMTPYFQLQYTDIQFYLLAKHLKFIIFKYIDFIVAHMLKC